MFETDASGTPVEVDDLDASSLLTLLTDRDHAERRAARAKLRLALQWCVLHPATDDTGFATWADAALPGPQVWDEPLYRTDLGGDGTPRVAAFAPEPFAAALGISTYAGMRLLADALDLVHRLPLLWARVQSLEIPAWRARPVAEATRELSRVASAAVDERLSSGGLGAADVEAEIAQAVAEFHPERQAAKELRGKESWEVALRHPAAADFAGTSTLTAIGDTLDLSRFHDLVRDHAVLLARLGDHDPYGARQSKALGHLADLQPVLPQDDGPAATDREGRALASGAALTAAAVSAARRSAKVRLYLHLDAAAVGDDATQAVGHAERLGPATAGQIREWVGHAQVTITPVLDLSQAGAVDPEDPPAWMRELVTLRDPHCVFPHCRRDARWCDLDHVTPYDPDGSAGQTRPDNLAPLCRRHQRLKTYGRWSYVRDSDGSYIWRDPTGRKYAVTRDGTHPLRD
ncbi:HNH endonuclease signature motif containing protein [Nocardioides speluncae]|uniref:HNH endonuclease signature motif containing protein n=1 Tax=Nocardioides speluncae TaxID=2670337 RepID=UPI000D69679F|nr:HNH endonuclease signature motif containing protein [Nocardioides speluncae]